MMDFLIRVEHSGFSTWVRGSGSVFSYPLILFLHTVGLSMVAGVNTAVDLRILGFAPSVRLAPMEKFYPIMWWGFAINAVTGVILLAASASTIAISGVFWTKMVLILLAVVDLQVIRNRIFRDPLVDKRPVPMNDRLLALLSILLWTGAITAGRLIAYVGAGAAENGITTLFYFKG
jgi:Family of unknown function (DUF6644)